MFSVCVFTVAQWLINGLRRRVANKHGGRKKQRIRRTLLLYSSRNTCNTRNRREQIKQISGHIFMRAMNASRTQTALNVSNCMRSLIIELGTFCAVITPSSECYFGTPKCKLNFLFLQRMAN